MACCCAPANPCPGGTGCVMGPMQIDFNLLIPSGAWRPIEESNPFVTCEEVAYAQSRILTPFYGASPIGLAWLYRFDNRVERINCAVRCSESSIYLEAGIFVSSVLPRSISPSGFLACRLGDYPPGSDNNYVANFTDAASWTPCTTSPDTGLCCPSGSRTLGVTVVRQAFGTVTVFNCGTITFTWL
jgi:hypothetical protein